jgi:hypothetical protein
MDEFDGAAARRTGPNLPYPGLFAELLETHRFVAFDVGPVRISGNVQGEDDSLEDLLSDTILTSALTAAGFLPFGRPVTGSYDRVCFDVRGKARAYDAPVVLMPHEAVLTRGRIPKPEHWADSLFSLLVTAAGEIEPLRRANRRQPSRSV